MPFHKLNEENLKIYLRNVLNYNTDVLKIEKFGVGQSNPTYHVYCGGREFVLRKKPPGKLLKGAHQVRREFKVISSLSKVGFCVPHPIAFCSDQNVLGTDFYLMEYVKGRVFYSSVPDMTKVSAREMIMSSICTLAKLHSYRPENIGLADYGRPDDYLKRQQPVYNDTKDLKSCKDVNRLLEVEMYSIKFRIQGFEYMRDSEYILEN